MSALKRLRLLNLSHNPLNQCTNSMIYDQEADSIELGISYFNIEWNLLNDTNIFHQLKILILNSCYVDLKLVECLLSRLPSLDELHLASNNYSRVTFSDRFVKYSIKILYFNNNLLSNWNEVCKLGRCFPNLENLVLSHNDLSNFSSIDEQLHTSKCFQNLEILILNKLQINDWSVIDQLREFPHLKHVRIQNIPLLNVYNDEEKYYLLVAHLNESIDSLNGSKITGEDKENCERKYIRHYLDMAQKPALYYELENKHGKLNKLADVNLEGNKRVHVKIKFRDEHIYERIDVRQTVGEFKKQLEKIVGLPQSRFKVFYIDIEACAMSICGHEELKYLSRCLYSYNIRDGDEIEIDLKPPPPVTHLNSEQAQQHSQHQNYHSNSCSVNSSNSNHQPVLQSSPKPLAIRNRKISDSQNASVCGSGASNIVNGSAGNASTTNSSSRLCKKTRSGLTNLSNSSTTTPTVNKTETAFARLNRKSFFQMKNNKHEGEQNVSFAYHESSSNPSIASHTNSSKNSSNNNVTTQNIESSSSGQNLDLVENIN